MIHRLENRKTPQPGTIWFVRTNHSRWRFPRDVSTVSYHAIPRRLGCPPAAYLLGIEEVSTPTTAALIALYASGLVLLDGRQTQTRVTRFLPSRCHDALNRLLRFMPLSTRVLMGLLSAWANKCREEGCFCLDGVVVEKAFAKKLPWAGWTYSFAKKRKVYGLHVVVLLWCSSDGSFRIPVAFRLWRPKHSCAPQAYRTKLKLVEAMLKEVVGSELHTRYIVFDTHYAAGWFTKLG